MAVSPGGKHLATASKDGIARVFDLSTAQLSGGFKASAAVTAWHTPAVTVATDCPK